MANRKALISGPHGGERLEISTQGKILLCRLWEKHRGNNRKMPDLVRQVSVTYLYKDSHHGKWWERNQLLTHILSQSVGMTWTALDG